MRKIVLEFEPGTMLMKMSSNLFDHIEEFEVLELLKMDFEKGMKIVLAEVKLKRGSLFEEIKWPKNMDVKVLGIKGGKYILIFTARAPNRIFKKLVKKAQADVIWTPPTHWKDGKMTLSCIGEEKELKKIIRGMKLFGTVSNVSYRKAVYQEHNLLSVLTDKQKSIMITAKRNGYYDYPRKINSEELARKVGVSKATVVEHLRKAEGRLLNDLLAGY